MHKMEAAPAWLRANIVGQRIGVDRANNAVLGYIVAQEGKFLEADPRGEFDVAALRTIVKLAKEKPKGLKVRFGHPSLSADSLSKFVGRSRNFRMDKTTVQRDGKDVEINAVRADMFLDSTAGEKNPNGNLSEYILSLAESDPDAFATSLVLQVDEEYRLNKDGTRKLDDDGVPLPPLWRPKALHASDVVDEGAACSSFLGADDPGVIVNQGAELLDRLFAGQERAVIESRCTAWLGRYLDAKFGKLEQVPPDVALAVTCPATDAPCTQDCPNAETCKMEEEMAAKDELSILDIEIRERELDSAKQ